MKQTFKQFLEAIVHHRDGVEIGRWYLINEKTKKVLKKAFRTQEGAFDYADKYEDELFDFQPDYGENIPHECDFVNDVKDLKESNQNSLPGFELKLPEFLEKEFNVDPEGVDNYHYIKGQQRAKNAALLKSLKAKGYKIDASKRYYISDKSDIAIEILYSFSRGEWRGVFLTNVQSIKQGLKESAPPDMEDWVKENKARFKKEYGDEWEQALYATAWKIHNLKSKKKISESLRGTVKDIKELPKGTLVYKRRNKEYFAVPFNSNKLGEKDSYAIYIKNSDGSDSYEPLNNYPENSPEEAFAQATSVKLKSIWPNSYFKKMIKESAPTKKSYQVKIDKADWEDIDFYADSLDDIVSSVEDGDYKKDANDKFPIYQLTSIVEKYIGETPDGSRTHAKGSSWDDMDFEVVQDKNDVVKIKYAFSGMSKRVKDFVKKTGMITIMSN